MTIPVAIIGAGPAGIAAAVQLRRSGIEFLLFEKGRIGGLLNEANRVENFPGIAGGVPGRVLAARLKRQLREAGICAEKSEVLHLSYRGGGFIIRTEKRAMAALKVILACGTLPLPFGPPLDSESLRGRLFDSVLPLLKASGETIAIVGGGDAAFDYALALAARNKVHVLFRSAKPRALPLLVERCRRQRRIVVHGSFRPAEALSGENGRIILKAAQAPGGGEIVCQRVLTAIGRAPALQFLDPVLRASLPALTRGKKIYLAGDAGNGRFRQAAIAAGDGLRAAMEIQQEARCR
jgi:thioredoxin reductase